MGKHKRESNSHPANENVKRFKSDSETQHPWKPQQSSEQQHLRRPQQSLKPHQSTEKKEEQVITHFNVQHYAESRAVEIQGLVQKLNAVKGNSNPVQKLPNHMRRRAMSHNIKRVPRRLRRVNAREIQRTKQSKRPSRKYRRRPSNLLSEYERRKRKIGWLETHIWHAKRFKMVEKWGYRLAYHPNDKSIRACYRAVNQHCMMQDVSFESYIELVGPREEILNGLSHLTSTETGPTFAAKMTAPGTIQGSVVLYSVDSYPHGCIGRVSYLWRPSQRGGSQDSTLWICSHPSFFVELLAQLKECFDQDGTEEAAVETNGNSADKKKVVVNCLKDRLVKLRLFGPASNAVLTEVLRPASVEPSSQMMDTDRVKSSKLVGGSSGDARAEGADAAWWKEYYKSDTTRDELKKQLSVWTQLRQHKSPAEAPPNCVIALTVRDPRLLLPPKRDKVSNAAGHSPRSLDLASLTPEVSNSPLWEVAVRANVKATKILEKDLNLLRGKALIPGSPLELGNKESRIPILLIQRPGSPSSSSPAQAGYASGWDILLPSGWAMAFWVALVYRGARVGGLREAGSVCLQARLLSTPSDFLDSRAGQTELKSQLETLQMKHDKRPLSKRPNYTKLGVPFPFELMMGPLVKQWSDQVVEVCKSLGLSRSSNKVNCLKENVCALRDRKLLRLLDNILSNPKKFLRSGLTMKDKSRHKSLNTNTETSIYSHLTSHPNGERLLNNYLPCVVPVFIHMLDRGVPMFRGHVCVPSAADLKMLDADKTYRGPFETQHKDPGLALRKAERKECLKLKKKVRKERKAKSEIDLAAVAAQVLQWIDPKLKPKPKPVEEKKEVKTEMNKEFDVLSHASRQIFGYVRNGHFNLSHGQGSGLAFCSLGGLLHMIEAQKDRTKVTVLIRNPTSLKFRFATVNVAL